MTLFITLYTIQSATLQGSLGLLLLESILQINYIVPCSIRNDLYKIQKTIHKHLEYCELTDIDRDGQLILRKNICSKVMRFQVYPIEFKKVISSIGINS